MQWESVFLGCAIVSERKGKMMKYIGKYINDAFLRERLLSLDYLV